MEELSKLVIETAYQRPATLKDFRTQELAIEMQIRLLELSNSQPIGSLQEEIAQKFCRFQIRGDGAKLNSATQNVIGYALARLLDTTPGDSDDVFMLTIKEVFTVCREKFCSTNGAPIGRLVDENLSKELAMLAQAEINNVLATYAKAKFAHIQPIIQQKTVQVEIEPRLTRCRAGQVIALTRPQLLDFAIDSLQDDA
jgi:hypothetical protein